LYLAHSHRITLHLDLRSQKSLALFVVLGLSLGALVFASGEARAAQKHPTVVQHSPTDVQQFSEKTSGEYSAATDKEGAEPVAETPSVVSYPVGTLFSAPPLLRGSTPKPLPNPTPEPALQPPPAPDSLQKPVSKLTREPTRPEDPEPTSGKSVSALAQNPALPVPLGREVPDLVPDPHSSEPTLPISEHLPEPVPEVDALKAEPVSLEAVMNFLRNGLLMRKTEDRRRTELTEESAFQYGFSAEFITRFHEKAKIVKPTWRL
jgi:hypothetical protein